METKRPIKQHVPRPGYSDGLQGPAYCGRWGHYRTGDHALIGQLASASTSANTAEAYCASCLRALEMAATEIEIVKTEGRP